MKKFIRLSNLVIACLLLFVSNVKGNAVFENNDSVKIKKSKSLEGKGNLMFLKVQFKKALIFYEEAIKINEQDDKLQKKIECIKTLIEAEKENKDLFKGTLNMADILFSNHEYKFAKLAYEKASKLTKDNKYSLQMIKTIEKLLEHEQ
jgi:tetratricopeptide (TPR) repeat protein